MSISLGQAVLHLATNDDGLKSGLSNARSTVTSSLGGLAKSAGLLVGGAVAGGVAAVGAAIGTAAIMTFDLANDVNETQGDIRAEFGLTAQEAERAARVARAAWTNNFGESIQDTGQIAGQALTVLGEMSDEALQQTIEASVGMRDAFGSDTAESISAAKTLMDNFGLSADEAFAYLVSGYQNGLNRSGDFLDTVEEYSTQFSNAGANVGEFFSLMESGLAGGMLGTDKAADAFKEFQVRILDGSETTSNALESLGFNSEHYLGMLADGQITVADLFEEVVGKLAETEDEATLMQAGVGLLGTQFEDLGASAVQGLSLTSDTFADTTGAVDSLGAQYNTLGDRVEGYKRRAINALAPVAEKVNEFISRMDPYIESAFGWIETKLAPAVERIAGKVGDFMETFFGQIEDGAGPLDAFVEAMGAFLPPDVIDRIQNFISGLRGAWDWLTGTGIPVFMRFAQPIIDFFVRRFGRIQEIVGAFGELLKAVFGGDMGEIGDKLGAFIGTFIENMVEDFGDLAGLVVPKLIEFWERIREWFSGQDWAANGKTLLDKIVEGAKDFWAGLSPHLTALWDSAVAWFQSVDWAQLGRDVKDFILDGLATIAEKVGEKLDAWYTAAAAYVAGIDWKQVGFDVVTFILEGLATIVERIQETDWRQLAIDILDPLLNGLATISERLDEWFGTVWTTLSTWFKETDWSELATSVIDGLVEGLMNGLSRIATAASELAAGARDAWNEFWDNRSPSHVAEADAEFVVQGYMKPLRNLGELVNQALDPVRGLMGGAVGAAGGTVNNYNEYHLHVGAGQAGGAIQEFGFLRAAAGAS